MSTQSTQTNASAAMTAHIPGPWNVTQFASQSSGTISIADRDGDAIAHAADIWQNREVIEANARLIAAAPDLLALLQGLLATAESVDAGNKAQHGRNCHGFATALFDKCHAAIARAKGDK